MLKKYSKGQILTSKHEDAKHIIVYMKQTDKSDDHFVGLMLTSKSCGGKNVKMLPEHFTNGFIYEDTHVVKCFLDKPHEWQPFKEIGNLTPSGLKFIYDNIITDESLLWEEYEKQ